MKRALLVFGFLLTAHCSLPPVIAQDTLSRVGATVKINADGSISVTPKSGKTLRLVPQASLPVGTCIDGSFFALTNVSLNYCTNGVWGLVGGSQDLSGYVPTSRTVNGHALSANVTVTKGDVLLGSADDTSDAGKPVSTAQQTALDLKANLSGANVTNMTGDNLSQFPFHLFTTLPGGGNVGDTGVKLSTVGTKSVPHFYGLGPSPDNLINELLTPHAETVVISGVAGTGGVVANTLVKLDTDGTIVPVTGTEAIFGVAKTTAAAGDPVQVTLFGPASCVAEGAITAGHYLQAGSTTKTKCLDTGQTSIGSIATTVRLAGKASTSVSDGATTALTVFGPFRSGENAVMYRVLLTDATGADSNAAQPWFPTAGAVTVQGATAYYFQGAISMSRTAGTVSHTTLNGFGGSATITAISYFVQSKEGDAATQTDSDLVAIQTATATGVKLASTSATENIVYQVWGTVWVDAGGTFIPQFTFDPNAPGGAPTIEAGTYFKLYPIGDNTVTAVGPWQ